MKCRYGFNLLFALCFAWLLVPFVSNAQTVSGYNTYYIQQTSNGTLPDNYSSTVSGIAFPTTSYTQLGAYQNQTYNVIRAMDFQFPNVEFVTGSTYVFTIVFDFGSYIYPNWPNNSANPFVVRSCPNGTCNTTTNWQLDSSHQSVSTLTLKINHVANSNQTGKTFGIGPMTGNLGLFYNAYSSQQGIRIVSATYDFQIDPNYQNTQDIINNNTQNTQLILDQLRDSQLESYKQQQVCQNVEVSINYNNKDDYNVGFLNSDNTINNVSTWRYTNYIELTKDNEYTLRGTGAIGNASYCFYNLDKTLISCTKYNETSLPVTFTPSSDMLFRFSGYVNTDYYITLFAGTVCKNGNQAIVDYFSDPNIDDSKVNDFFGDLDFYDNNNFSSLITSPINFLNSLNDTCQPINLQLFGKTVSLPCGTTVFWEKDLPNISTFRVFWNVLFGGALIYTLGLLLVKNISDAIDPTKDNIGGFQL